MIEVKTIKPTEEKCSMCGRSKRVAVIAGNGGGGEVRICQRDLWKFIELTLQMNGRKAD